MSCLLSILAHLPYFFFFFFNDTATTEIYTLSLHDALPIWSPTGPPGRAGKTLRQCAGARQLPTRLVKLLPNHLWEQHPNRSEEHTSELQSRPHLVCRLLLEKKKKNKTRQDIRYLQEADDIS